MSQTSFKETWTFCIPCCISAYALSLCKPLSRQAGASSGNLTGFIGQAVKTSPTRTSQNHLPFNARHVDPRVNSSCQADTADQKRVPYHRSFKCCAQFYKTATRYTRIVCYEIFSSKRLFPSSILHPLWPRRLSQPILNLLRPSLIRDRII